MVTSTIKREVRKVRQKVTTLGIDLLVATTLVAAVGNARELGVGEQRNRKYS